MMLLPGSTHCQSHWEEVDTRAGKKDWEGRPQTREEEKLLPFFLWALGDETGYALSTSGVSMSDFFVGRSIFKQL